MKLRILLAAGLMVGWVLGVAATPLDDYVAAPDPNYSYTLANTLSGPGYTAKVYDMTSQAWRNPSEVDRTLWKHWVRVIVPDTVDHPKALMWIAGGGNGGPVPDDVDSKLLSYALSTNSIVAEVKMIPNQPIKFSDETDPRYLSNGREEDELIAYAWDKYLRGASVGQEDPKWLPRLPMTKAVVRAMDTVQAEFPTITGFMVAGASKRGWTTWTTAAVDPRVEAIAPHVIDVLNVEESFQHHWEAYGYWADAVSDYVDMGIINWLHTPEFRSLLAIVDPYSYRRRLTMPKFIVNASGDQFFLPDSSQFYFNNLVGEKHLNYVPNTDHGLDMEAVHNFVAYYYSYLNNVPRPNFSWTKTVDGSLRVRTVSAPTAVYLWQATNPNERNFRLDSIGPSWTSSPLSDQGGGLYVGNVPEPPQGWTAFFVQLEFPSGTLYPFRFTTEVSVVPDVLPFKPTPSPTVTMTFTPTLTPTPTVTFTPTITLTPTLSPTPTVTNTPRVQRSVAASNVGDGPVHVAAGKLAGAAQDGAFSPYQDVVTANRAGDSLTILLNDGAGHFPLSGNLLSMDPGSKPSFVALEDLDGDSKTDLLVVAAGTNRVLLYTGTGAGGFNPIPAAIPHVDSPLAAFAGDLNNDGRYDVAITNSESDSVTVILGTAAGVADPSAPFRLVPVSAGGEGKLPSYITGGHLNGDMNLDLVTPNWEDSTVSLLFGMGNGNFQNPRILHAGTNPRTVAIADLDGVNGNDLIVLNQGAPQVSPPIPGSVMVFHNDGSGNFGDPYEFYTGPGPVTAIPLDFDGDGAQDLALVHSGIPSPYSQDPVSGDLTIYYNDGNATFSNFDRFAQIGTHPISAVPARLDDTIANDLVVVDQAGDQVTFFNVAFPPVRKTYADFNLDGKTDSLDLFALSRLFGMRDPRTRIIGDLSGDDFLDPKDVISYLQVRDNEIPAVRNGVGEKAAARVPSVISEAADINQDGLVDVRDIWAAGGLGN
jgi:PhoPQ-activated pathogenicity-related protein